MQWGLVPNITEYSNSELRRHSESLLKEEYVATTVWETVPILVEALCLLKNLYSGKTTLTQSLPQIIPPTVTISEAIDCQQLASFVWKLTTASLMQARRCLSLCLVF